MMKLLGMNRTLARVIGTRSGGLAGPSWPQKALRGAARDGASRADEKIRFTCERACEHVKTLTR